MRRTSAAEVEEELRCDSHSLPAVVPNAASSLGIKLPAGLQATPVGLAEAVGYGREARSAPRTPLCISCRPAHALALVTFARIIPK